MYIQISGTPDTLSTEQVMVLAKSEKLLDLFCRAGHIFCQALSFQMQTYSNFLAAAFTVEGSFYMLKKQLLVMNFHC